MLDLLFAVIYHNCIPRPPPLPVINNCSSVTIDLSAIATLNSLPWKAFEYGVSIDCKRVGNAIVTLS
jgi:hypothetical protein